MTESVGALRSTIRVERWPSERPLRALVWLTALTLWVVLAVSLIGIFYALFLGLFFFVVHLTFVTHLRGNGVRLGPDQMPELYERVAQLSARVGLGEVPEAYVVQAGGALNALATRFLRAQFIVLFSDLLEACGDNTEARDFIIAHELGHLHAGHLRLRWLLLPGLAIPFLGTAYSRACEYTCDRYGAAATDDGERALDGLCILAAGGRYGPKVNRRALVSQRASLNTILMKIGVWLSTHPPIAHRLAALKPTLGEGALGGRAAGLAAFGVLLLVLVVPLAVSVAFTRQVWPSIEKAIEENQQQTGATASVPGAPDDARGQAETGILSLAEAAEAHRAEHDRVPSDVHELYRAWASLHPMEPHPVDPYQGSAYGYHTEGGEYVIWTVGPDPNDESDDLYYSSQAVGAQ